MIYPPQIAKRMIASETVRRADHYYFLFEDGSVWLHACSGHDARWEKVYRDLWDKKVVGGRRLDELVAEASV